VLHSPRLDPASVTTESPASDSSRPAAPRRTLLAFLLLLAIGLIPYYFALRTVHRRQPQELLAQSGRAHYSIRHWVEHGYWKSGGMLFRAGPADSVQIYRSSTGGVLLTGFIVEKIYFTITGRYHWPLLALHNQFISLLAATAVALLAFRFALRLGASRLHAFALAIFLQTVIFTFPDNLATYWEMQGRLSWLLFAALFLLLDERRSESHTRLLPIAQAVLMFFLMFVEYVAGVFFVAAYCAVQGFLAWDRGSVRRIALVVILPALLAVGVFAAQKKWIDARYPDAVRQGSGFMTRSGLDGSVEYYGDHRHIAYGRDIARLNFPEKTRPYILNWQWLFIGGTIAVFSMIVAAARGHFPIAVLAPLLSLVGAYLLYGGMFSQSMVIHPYYYDVMLFAPLAMALFVLFPSWIASKTPRPAVTVVLMFFFAFWVSMIQVRRYAVRYPLPDPVAIAPVSSR